MAIDITNADHNNAVYDYHGNNFKYDNFIIIMINAYPTTHPTLYIGHKSRYVIESLDFHQDFNLYINHYIYGMSLKYQILFREKNRNNDNCEAYIIL